MIAIIDYGAGNIASVCNALNRLGVNATITKNPEIIELASHVIFPGVGAAGPAMKALQQSGIAQLIPELKQPVLGICLGMQLLCESTEEQNTKGLGVFSTAVELFEPKDIVPHMGWNTITIDENSKLLKSLNLNDNVYFVHSYCAEISKQTTAVCDYITPFSAVLEYNNFFGVQFHPEKSGGVGATVLKNFLKL